jgi:predicted helicase
MLVQHLLTERIFRKVFNNQEFLSRNVIAAEIEKVIRSITARHFSRDEFLKPLDRFYTAIERAAESQTGYTEKQHFLNAVYEKFFQRFDRKQADTHGIVYTPQPIVDFMVRSVEEILKGYSSECIGLSDHLNRWPIRLDPRQGKTTQRCHEFCLAAVQVESPQPV